MDFVAVMPFTQSLYNVFQLESLILFILEILLLRIKSQFLSLLKKKKELFHMKLFLCSSGISLGRDCQKILTKRGGFRKKLKRRLAGGGGGGGGGGVSIERGSKLLHTMH